jgi:hypothetical protein
VTAIEGKLPATAGKTYNTSTGDVWLWRKAATADWFYIHQFFIPYLFNGLRLQLKNKQETTPYADATAGIGIITSHHRVIPYSYFKLLLHLYIQNRHESAGTPKTKIKLPTAPYQQEVRTIEGVEYRLFHHYATNVFKLPTVCYKELLEHIHSPHTPADRQKLLDHTNPMLMRSGLESAEALGSLEPPPPLPSPPLTPTAQEPEPTPAPPLAPPLAPPPTAHASNAPSLDWSADAWFDAIAATATRRG